MAGISLECKCAPRGFLAKAEGSALSQKLGGAEKSFKRYICGHPQIKDIKQKHPTA